MTRQTHKVYNLDSRKFVSRCGGPVYSQNYNGTINSSEVTCKSCLRWMREDRAKLGQSDKPSHVGLVLP